MTKELLSKLLKIASDDIAANHCGLDDEELSEIAELIVHKKITLEQLCHDRKISRATLNRRIKDGVYPQPKKDPGGKKYYWKDEIDNIK